ncbi:phage holin family protein [Streptomyces sp. NBC_01317]|uniref:phage holin family protein n=1 Tax=Streptomyces sp. NBC_01317 TaxID=2903822 RepID=UPI002E15323F|nr:phage holin family protein [Streptomyces sp. NBC_01317]
MTTAERHAPSGGAEDTTSVLVTRATRQLSQLVREEMQLARAEMTEKGKRLGAGGGLFGGAGLVGVLAAQALVVAVIAALALVLPVWASALVVTAGLAAVAALLAVAGKRQVTKAVPPTPEQTIDSVKADVAEIKEKAHR